jgi:hypothetical protein
MVGIQLDSPLEVHHCLIIVLQLERNLAEPPVDFEVAGVIGLLVTDDLLRFDGIDFSEGNALLDIGNQIVRIVRLSLFVQSELFKTRRLQISQKDIHSIVPRTFADKFLSLLFGIFIFFLALSLDK